MTSYPHAIEDLIEAFRKLPGVGPKSAERFAFHLLRTGAEEVGALIERLGAARDRIDRCTTCGTFAEGTTCVICSDPRRDRTTLCVVAEAPDLLAIERTHEFRGVYHLLGGLLAPIEGIGPEQLRIRELVERIREPAPNSPSTTSSIREIIIALDPTIEGETTLNYLARLLAPSSIRVTRIARGLPVGGDLEYADPVTLGDALSGRREVVTHATTET